MKEINLKGLDLSVYEEELSNGLKIYYLPITNNKKYNIQFVVRLGGRNRTFEYENEMITLPEGTAHYLEHKVFENEDGSNTFELFNNHATYGNAFTNDKRTTFLCRGTSNFEEDLKILLNFVTKPYFTDENVEKERGIISEEIKQNEDNVYRRLYNNQLKGLFHSKEYQQTVIGTIESINKIDKDILYKAYNTFYNPSNTFIVITGNFNIDNASRIIKEILSKKKGITIKQPNIEEKESVVKKKIELESDHETNKILIGIKKDISNINLSKFEIDVYTSILLEMIFGETTNFRQEIYDKKIVTSFSTASEINGNTLILRIFGVSDQIDTLINKIENELKNIKLDQKTFNRIKKVILAHSIIDSDYSEQMISNIVGYLTIFDDIVPDRTEKIRKLNIEQLEKLVKEFDFNNKNITLIKKSSLNNGS